MHGNFHSTWISEGGYEPVAELLLGGVDYDGFFLEYDTERAGAEPLFLPQGGAGGRRPHHLQDGTLRRRTTSSATCDKALEDAPPRAAVPLPAIGLASTEEELTEEQQWAKLKMIVDVSREVWK